MTLEEYLQDVLSDLKKSDTKQKVNLILKGVSQTIKSSGIASLRIRWFWSELYNSVENKDGFTFLKEAGAAADLNALVNYALTVISDYSAESKK